MAAARTARWRSRVGSRLAPSLGTKGCSAPTQRTGHLSHVRGTERYQACVAMSPYCPYKSHTRDQPAGTSEHLSLSTCSAYTGHQTCAGSLRRQATLGHGRACPCTPAPCLLSAHPAALDPCLSAAKQMDGKVFSQRGCAFQVSNKSSFSCPSGIL